MQRLTVALFFGPETVGVLNALARHPLVEQILLLSESGLPAELPPAALEKTRALDSDILSARGVARLLDAARTEYLLVIFPGELIEPGYRFLERMVATASDTGAGLVYSDFRDIMNGKVSDHPLLDYQEGSIRDGFDFGSMILLSRSAAEDAIRRHGAARDRLRWAGFYDLRLKLSLDYSILRIPEPLYTRIPVDQRATGERQFDYVDPRKRDYQIEMEEVATAHLKRAGAYLAPEFKSVERSGKSFPVKASIVIPVRNRERTIKDAVRSALSQSAPFDFNVIVVDNHSTDRTSEILSELQVSSPRLLHIQPERTDLGIGGCWNEAIYSSHCGEYGVQLDSDDLYSDEQTLERIISKFDEGDYAMVIGSYTIVNFDLQEMAPGLIDHREWTRENGRNNALRINGLGAPRAFYVPLLRQTGLPNTSYGEDYAAALRISRDYEIGRIFEPVYYARRWEGNSDAALPLATANRYDAYKDHLRTVEILARKRKNRA
jgi:hypothetical protein